LVSESPRIGSGPKSETGVSACRVFWGVDGLEFGIEEGEGVPYSGSGIVSIEYSDSEPGFVEVVEVVKGLLGKELLELSSSSSVVSASKSHVRNGLGLPGTGRLGLLWCEEDEAIVRKLMLEMCEEGIGFVARSWALNSYIYLQF